MISLKNRLVTCPLCGAIILFLTMNCTNRNTNPETGCIGPSDPVIENGHMSPEVLLSFGRLSDPQLSPDGTRILYGVSYTSIEQNRSCRNLFLCNVDGSGKVQLTKAGKSITNARWTDGGKKIAYIQGGQIYSAPIKGKRLGKAAKVSDIPGGISEFYLSPDQTRILYTGTVPGSVKTPADFDPALDKAKAYVAEDLMHRHWDHWVTGIPHAFIAPWNDKEISADNSVDLLGSEPFELPMEPFGGIEQLSWSPDGEYIAYSCKKKTGKEYAFSTDSEIYIYKVMTGETTVIPMGGGYDTDPVWSPDGKSIAWLSMARNGYEADKTRLMTADVIYPEGDGLGRAEDAKITFGNIRDITAGFKYNASSPVWSSESKSIYFNALTEGLQAIYRADLDSAEARIAGDTAQESFPTVRTAGEASIVRLTSGELWFDFNSPFAVLEDKTLLTSYCSMDFPNELVAVKASGDIRQISSENEHILSRLAGHRTEARMVKTVDGKDMLTWVLFPPGFDENKVYPAIEICLGGPQGTLSQGWSYRWNYRLMAAQGYVVVLPNRRGTTAFGPEWTEQISGDYTGLNMQDYLSAARMIKEEPYIGKLAACGASYGGYSVYYLAGIHGDVYDCFVSHAGIFDEAYMYYETEEMWFPNWDNGGLHEYGYTPGKIGPEGDGETFGGIRQGGSPWSDNPKARRHYANSPAANVTKWHTPILCIHGEKDYRIPYDQGMAAFNAAQMMGVPSKLIVFPEENHWILQPQNALFWHRSYFDWLDKWCK